MSKTAIIITGAMRTFERCLPTLHWHVFRRYQSADFFVSTMADSDASKAELLRAKYPQAHVEIETVAEQPDCVAEQRAAGVTLPAEWVKGKPYTHEPFAISVHPQAVLRQLWQLRQGWELFCNTSQIEEYDMVIRCRPDLWFHSFKKPETYNGVGGDWLWAPWWGNFGGINDRFAIMESAVAPHYFGTYGKIKALTEAGCPVHPETLIAASVAAERAVVVPLFAEFSTLRANGDMRAPEISSIDLAHLNA
jgi:hypothetical protein